MREDLGQCDYGVVIGLTPPIAIGSVHMPNAVGIQQHSPVPHVAAQNVPLYMLSRHRL